MLNDVHLKVLYYEPDSSKVFSNTDIKGGVAITYRDGNAEFGAIGSFTPYNELNDILHRVKNHKSFCFDRKDSNYKFCVSLHR